MGGIRRGDLERDLRAAVRGEVRFGDGDRALYSMDASNYRQVPIGAVLPADADDVAAAVAVCRAHGAPVLARGGGTSLAGQAVNEAVVLDTTRHLDRVLEVQPGERTARVEPGVVLDALRAAAAPFGLTFGPDPATHDRCTLGGMIGNNSCGVHSLRAGRTVDQVLELDVLTYDGLRMTVGPTIDAARGRHVAAGGRRGGIYAALGRLADRHAAEVRRRFPAIPRRVSGYNLDELLPERGFNVARALVGTEGTCVVVLGATVRLVPSPAARRLVVAGFPGLADAADRVPAVLELAPEGLEAFDDRLAGFARRKHLHAADLALLPPGGGWLLVETDGETPADAQERARAAAAALEGLGGRCTVLDDGAARRVWRLRESAVGAMSFLPGGPEYWPGWEDSAVAPERLGPYLRDLRSLCDRYGYTPAMFGHFGEGCVHAHVDFDLRSAGGIAAWRRFLEDAADLVVSYGGSLSGEHGDGRARSFLYPRMFGDELVGAFRSFKAIWDPEGRMNPGRIVDPLPFDEQLRLGAGHRPARPATRFAFGAGGLSGEVDRCVGLGACRRSSGGTMCPSYRATREEMHSTRGRARLLFEMLEGEVIGDGWRSVEVRRALDLCLSCKACRTECPMGIDMAAYKAEFLSHHYRRRLRPRAAYTMGLFPQWGRVAALAPRAVNAVTGGAATGGLVKALAGVAPERRIPAFATWSFLDWFRGRPPAGGGARVVLWPDTFNVLLHPEILCAAVEVLEDGGYGVQIPAEPVCCGRPLYDFGMLGPARRRLLRLLDGLEAVIGEGVPVVVLEPSCLSVFRDELPGLLPADPRARRLAALAVSLAELLVRGGYRPPPIGGGAVYHGHCHQKALAGASGPEPGPEAALLAAAGVETTELDSGCCGMAGAFGFDRERYDVSMRIGELALLPAVRATPPGHLVVADGFSCREQILQATGRRALHTGEVLRAGLPARSRGDPPAG